MILWVQLKPMKQARRLLQTQLEEAERGWREQDTAEGEQEYSRKKQSAGREQDTAGRKQEHSRRKAGTRLGKNRKMAEEKQKHGQRKAGTRPEETEHS